MNNNKGNIKVINEDIDKNELTKDENHIYYLGIPKDDAVDYNFIKEKINKMISDLNEDLKFSKENGMDKFTDFIDGINENIKYYENLINNIENILIKLEEKNKIIKIDNNYKRIS